MTFKKKKKNHPLSSDPERWLGSPSERFTEIGLNKILNHHLALTPEDFSNIGAAACQTKQSAPFGGNKTMLFSFKHKRDLAQQKIQL